MGKLTLNNDRRKRSAAGHVCAPFSDAEVIAAIEQGSLRDGILYECDCGKQWRYNAPRTESWTPYRVVVRKPKAEAPQIPGPDELVAAGKSKSLANHRAVNK